MDLCPERDEPNESVIREQPDRAAHCRFHIFQLLLNETGVEDEEENGGRRRGGVEGVLDSGALAIELPGDISFADRGVVMGELVAGETEGADPDLGGEVAAGVGVEDGGAGGLAAERRVREGDDFGVRADGGDGSSDGDDTLRGLDL